MGFARNHGGFTPRPNPAPAGLACNTMQSALLVRPDSWHTYHQKGDVSSLSYQEALSKLEGWRQNGLRAIELERRHPLSFP
jgi:hypothetical protein